MVSILKGHQLVFLAIASQLLTEITTQPDVQLRVSPVSIPEFCPFTLNCTFNVAHVVEVQLIKNDTGLMASYDTLTYVSTISSSFQGRIEIIDADVTHVAANLLSALPSDVGSYQCVAVTGDPLNTTVASPDVTITITDPAVKCNSTMCDPNLVCINTCQFYRCQSDVATSTPAASQSQTTSPGPTSSSCENVSPVPASVSVLLGGVLLIECQPLLSTSAVVTWSRVFPNGSISALSSKVNFTISAALPSDAGVYRCTVSDSQCVSQNDVTVAVTWDVPPTTSSQMSLKKTAGDTLQLTCNVTTTPVSRLYWTFLAYTVDVTTEAMDLDLTFAPAGNDSLMTLSPSSAAPSPSPSPSPVTNKTTDSPAPAVVVGTPADGEVILTIDSLSVYDSGLYSCVADPGGMNIFKFAIETYNVVVAPQENGAGGQSQDGGGLPTYAKALIAIVVILVVVGIVALVIYKLKKKQNPNDVTPNKDTEEQNKEQPKPIPKPKRKYSKGSDDDIEMQHPSPPPAYEQPERSPKKSRRHTRRKSRDSDQTSDVSVKMDDDEEEQDTYRRRSPSPQAPPKSNPRRLPPIQPSNRRQSTDHR